MKTDFWFVSLFPLILTQVIGCEDNEAAASEHTDTDTDSDSAAYADVDSDTNSESGTDSDIHTGMPVFLLAGQSNMEGNVNEVLFEDLLAELETGPPETLQQRLTDRLTLWYESNDGYGMYGYSEQKMALETSELIRLHGEGLVDGDLTTPYSEVLCAMNETPVAPLETNCGHPFGPELLLGHYLGTTSYTPTALIKVAKGGTTLLVDWTSPTSAGLNSVSVGEWYTKLKQRIESLDSEPATVHPACATQECRWGAFIWFQGENDCFDQENAEAYEQNLTNFIADVRAEIGAPSLPVIIVEIGEWAQKRSFGNLVVAAQQAVVQADPDAELVVTDDLSGFYHYDPAAQLIIGERIAKVLATMLE